MPLGENLSEMSAFKLRFRGQEVVLALSEVRSVACSELLVPITDSDLTVAPAQPSENASAAAASASAAMPDQPALRLASNLAELAATLEDARAKPMISAARAV